MRDNRNVTILALSVVSAFLAGSLIGGGPGALPSALAQQGGSTFAGGTVHSNDRFIAATGSVGSGMSVLWLIDTKSKRLLVYGTSSLGKNVELRAARNIEWDSKLEEYNDDSQYSSEDLEKYWQRLRSSSSKRTGGAKPADGGKAPGTGADDSK